MENRENTKIFIPKDMVFFGESGLTSTSANHLANKAKEAIKDLEAKLAKVKFYDVDMMLMSNPNEVVEYQKGMTLDDVLKIDELLSKIAKTNSLIAWLREAITAKKTLEIRANNYSGHDFAKLKGIEYPEWNYTAQTINEVDVINKWDINKRNKYFTLEAICSTYGKAIHPKGSFYEAKQTLNEVVNNPAKLDGSGRDCIVYKYKESVSQEEVQKTWNKLNDYLRSKEAQLNSLKYEIENEVRLHNANAIAEYNKLYEEYSLNMKVFNTKFEEYKTKCKEEISNLKIVIPDELKDIYDEVK